MSDSLQPPGVCVAYQAPLFVEFSRPEYWSGLPFPPPRDLPDPGIKPWSPSLQADSLLSEPLGIVNPKKKLHAGENLIVMYQKIYCEIIVKYRVVKLS